ncbi:hypothetical protein ACLMJK_008742 [Lecanora helva]
MKLLRNPISFTPVPVTVITSFVYAALIIALLVVHHTVPEHSKSLAGTNLTEAWLDLQTLTDGFHPYNSRRNDWIRDWLLTRIEAILAENGILTSSASLENPGSRAVIFSDIQSNASFAEGGREGTPGISVYFEGTNIIVYLRGSEDDPGEWYLKDENPEGKGGVLVNAHYDSVSTGFGATDDGVGVVTILQLIKFFLSKDRQPKKGIVALLNNGEEDFLNGAWAFAKHPISRFPHTFLNLEGAGAGGKATLFRSTDTEVTRAYGNSKYPFGSVVSADAFQRGVIRSSTDYEVFKDVLGMRGLDVAFMEPRARYHTSQDDTRHTNKASLNHMLSAALATVKSFSSDTSSAFDGQSPEKGKVASGKGSSGVWFDLFGSAFAVFRLRTLFALSVTLLVVAPLTLIVIGVVLYKVDRLYLFSASTHHHHTEGDDTVAIQGWRGLFRYPITFLLATAAVIGLAFLVKTANPYIMVSSPYSVWSMMISSWIFVSWVCLRTADSLRPTALQRTYTLFWMFLAGWLVLIVTTVAERNPKIAGGYLIFFDFACIYLATTVSWLELFGLPRKSVYADEIEGNANEVNPTARSRPGSAAEEESAESRTAENDGEEATETTSLLGDREQRTTFKRYTSPHRPGPTDDIIPKSKTNRLIYGSEQPWSHSLPSSLWFLEFLLLAVFPLIIFGQVALLLTSATFQTPSDGNDPLPIYLLTATLTVILFAPLSPYLHRYTYHIPVFLLLVFIGATIYNLTAFPFSPNNRLKLFFLQKVDLDTGVNAVSLTGIGSGPYLYDAVSSLPSAAGQRLSCTPSTRRRDLTECSWHGLPPCVVPETHPHIPPEKGYGDWLTFNATRDPDGRTEAHFYVSGRETRACKIVFNRPISDFSVDGADDSGRFEKVSEHGSKELRLWSRTWDRGWNVKVKWEADGEGDGGIGMDGRVVCLWSDANDMGTIPALDEIRRFAPIWVAVTKSQDALVEGSKAFLV